MKYIRKGALELYDKGLIDLGRLKLDIYEVEAVDEDTTVQSKYGEVLVTKGNYIMTDKDGNQFGMTAQDLHNQFDEE